MEAVNDRIKRYLQDVHAAEKVTEDVLDKLADDAEAVAEVRLTAGECSRECQQRQAGVSDRLRALGSQSSAIKDFANSTMGVVGDIFNSGHDRNDKITMDSIKAHSALHLLHASYCALEAYATAVGDHDTARMAGAFKSEAEMAATRMIPAIAASATRVLTPLA